jgi:hypothetical protein
MADDKMAESSLATPEKAAASDLEAPAAPPLPLRPTLHDRLTYQRARFNIFTTRLLPQEHYFHPMIARARLVNAILILFIILLLLIAILPAVLVTRRKHSSSSTFLPLPTGAQTYTGDATYYNPALGSCGISSTDNDLVAAISWKLYDAMGAGNPNPNLNPACGRKVRVKRVGRATGVTVTIVDRCTGCQPTDIDMSPAAFSGVGEQWEGRVPVEWAWVS